MSIPPRGLAFRLSLYLAAAVAIFLGLFGAWAVREGRSHLEQTVVDSSDQVSDVIRRSTRSFMFRNERKPIFEIIQAIGEQPGLDRIRIYDKEGRIRYSTAADEIDHKVDMKAEACVSCHGGDLPSPVIHRDQRYRVFRSPDGHRTLGMITPIGNEAACSQADCHFHPPEQSVLGVLDVQMSLAKVDADQELLTRQLALSAIAAVLGLIVISAGILYRLVHRPVKGLILGTHRVASGDLTAQIPPGSRDELGELADSFNLMTAELGEARAQADAWARTLEDRVEEKSQQLEKVQEEIVQMERLASMGKLAAIVAHEINNPLSGIRTYARLMLKRRVTGGQNDESEMLSQIESESARCGEIVKNLLQFARPTRPKVEPLDLNELVNASVRLVQHQIDLQGLRRELRLSEGLPAIVCDPQQIRQALVAVLINACEAMPNEGTITVSTDRDEDGGVIISVGDTGVGMDEETKWHVFEPFYTTKEGGGGLGLAVVYGIIRNHGGRVDVESAPGCGTRIRFHLPARPPEAGTEKDAELAK
jgi:two-component system NtrC family sensor kinase